MKSYSPCEKSVHDRLTALVNRYHADLKKAGVKVDLLFVADENEDADVRPLTLHGYPCAAVVRKLGTKDRAAGRGDAEIVIDQARYMEMRAAEQDALLDHELYHLMAVKDGGQFKRDAIGRPVLKLRRHDRQLGWFDEIARRHGENSHEVQQARRLVSEARQTYFAFETHPAPASAAAA